MQFDPNSPSITRIWRISEQNIRIFMLNLAEYAVKGPTRESITANYEMDQRIGISSSMI